MKRFWDKVEKKDKKEVNQKEAFDLLFYDKVNMKDFWELSDAHIDLKRRVDRLETMLGGYIASSNACKQSTVITDKEGCKEVLTTKTWEGKPIVFKDIGGTD